MVTAWLVPVSGPPRLVDAGDDDSCWGIHAPAHFQMFARDGQYWDFEPGGDREVCSTTTFMGLCFGTRNGWPNQNLPRFHGPVLFFAARGGRRVDVPAGLTPERALAVTRAGCPFLDSGAVSAIPTWHDMLRATTV